MPFLVKIAPMPVFSGICPESCTGVPSVYTKTTFHKNIEKYITFVLTYTVPKRNGWVFLVYLVYKKLKAHSDSVITF